MDKHIIVYHIRPDERFRGRGVSIRGKFAINIGLWATKSANNRSAV